MSLNPHTKRSKYLTQISGVVAGGSVIATVETGQSIDHLKVRYSESGVLASVTAGIDRVRIVVDGDTKLDLTPLQILDLCKLNGYVPKVGELPIFFTEPSKSDQADEEWTMLDLFAAVSCHIELKIAAAATSPSLQIIAMRSQKSKARNNGIQLVPVRQALDFVTGGAGTLNITDLPKGKNITRILFYHPAGVSRVEMSVDGVVQNELSADENESELEGYGLNPTATGIDYACVFTVDQKASSAIMAERSLLAKVTVGGPGQLTAVIESLEPMR